MINQSSSYQSSSESSHNTLKDVLEIDRDQNSTITSSETYETALDKLKSDAKKYAKISMTSAIICGIGGALSVAGFLNPQFHIFWMGVKFSVALALYWVRSHFFYEISFRLLRYK